MDQPLQLTNGNGSNGHAKPGSPARYTGEILLRTRPKTYRKVVDLLSKGESALYISKECKVSRMSVDAIKERESADIAQRKMELSNICADVAHIGFARVADTIGKARCRDAVIGAGVAVDKLLALTGQGAAVQVAIVNMPSDADREKQREIDDKLDAIFRALPSRE